MLRIGSAFLLCWLVFGCTASRKLSQLERREPAATQEPAAVSDLRMKIAGLTAFPRSCPKEIHAFPDLADDRVRFPECPAGFSEAVQNALPFLKLEERSAMEEVLSSRCRSLGYTEYGDSLENLVASYDTTGPTGRRSRLTETVASMAGDLKTLQELKSYLDEIVSYHLPLDRWVRRNGEFVLPEEDLQQLYRLVLEKSCKMTDQEVDQAYRTIRGMEELEKILKDGPQREAVKAFLLGVHKIIEQKLKEFF